MRLDRVLSFVLAAIVGRSVAQYARPPPPTAAPAAFALPRFLPSFPLHFLPSFLPDRAGMAGGESDREEKSLSGKFIGAISGKDDLRRAALPFSSI